MCFQQVGHNVLWFNIYIFLFLKAFSNRSNHCTVLPFLAHKTCLFVYMYIVLYMLSGNSDMLYICIESIGNDLYLLFFINKS